MPVATGGAEECTADFAQSADQLPAVERRKFLAHDSGREDEFVAEGRRNRASCFQQRFQMDLGRFLKPKQGLAFVLSVRVAAGQEEAFRDENAVFVAADFDFRQRHNHWVEG